MLEFYVLLRDSALGLGLIMGKYDTLSYKTTLIFDQTPPTKVDSVKAVKDGDSIRVSWKPSNDSNFYAYIIRSFVNTGSQVIMSSQNLRSMDTIYDRLNTVFMDDTLDAVYGLSRAYQVETFNRVTSAFSTPSVYSFFSVDSYFWPFPSESMWAGPQFLPGQNTYLVAHDNRIDKLSYPDNTVLAGTTSLGGYRFGLSSDGSKIANYMYPDDVVIANTSDMSLLTQFQLGIEPIFNPDLEIVWGDSDRIVMDSFIVSVSAQAIVQRLPFPADRIAKSPNSKKMYVGFNNKIATLDFSSDTVQVLDIKTVLGVLRLAADPWLDQIYVVYAVDSKTIRILETTGLTEIGQIAIDNDYNSIMIAQSGLYVSFQTGTGMPLDPGKVRRFDRQTFLELQHYDFSSNPGRVVVAPDQQYMYVLTGGFYTPFIIPLGD